MWSFFRIFRLFYDSAYGAFQDKILQSTGRGRQVTVTNDGATILKSLHIDNPAAKVLVGILFCSVYSVYAQWNFMTIVVVDGCLILVMDASFILLEVVPFLWLWMENL